MAEGFPVLVAEAAAAFRRVEPELVVRIISHHDADGITAAAVLASALRRMGRRFAARIVPQLTEEIVAQVAREPYNIIVFTDLGTGQLRMIADRLDGKRVFILDHHQPDGSGCPDWVVHCNPRLAGLDGAKDISGAGVVYLFAKELDPTNTGLAHLAVIGAIGDVQDKGGFSPLNRTMLEDAIRAGTLSVERGPRFFGTGTRPLHKLLEFSTEPFIPGVTGSERSALAFLREAGIEARSGDRWRYLHDLSAEETGKLVRAIVGLLGERGGQEQVMADRYLIAGEGKGSAFSDAREFSTVLNACGRLGRAGTGIGACLGDPSSKRRAAETLSAYRQELIMALRWYDAAKGSGRVVAGDGYRIIDLQDDARHAIAGTIASIVSREPGLPKGTFVVAMARIGDGTTKVSIRIAGRTRDTDLKEVLGEITEKTGGEAGGHRNAAGARIRTADEAAFIAAARSVLEREAMEESIAA
ncbi:DHH family phosphoesterase [Candidatus Woesearchaeota archaeon]|nr:DHH family phosphoesterase [Candidatus Woesearchaeota archaeon]